MPKPAQSPVPIMNAGTSPRGMRFAAEHADLCFVIVSSEDRDEIREYVQGYKQMAREQFGREVKVWVHTVVVQRDTQAEADAYLRRFSVEYEDTESVDAWMRLSEINTGMPPEILRLMRQRFAAGAGGFPLVGTARTIAERLTMLSSAGIDGALLTWVDYDTGIEQFVRDVLPRLEQAGLRAPTGQQRGLADSASAL